MASQTLKDIKHQFMVFRNGIVADALRNAGMPYHIIFGLQLPQLSQIARSLSSDSALARELWEDKNVRESRLLACYVFPKEEVSQDVALELASSVQTPEEADILCFRLLRYLPFADTLASQLEDSDNPTVAYCSKALRRNLTAM